MYVCMIYFFYKGNGDVNGDCEGDDNNSDENNNNEDVEE